MSFDYFSKRRMQYILEKLKTIFDTKTETWTGTTAEYEAQASQIANGTIVNLTDDQENIPTGGLLPHIIISTETGSTILITKGTSSITPLETSTGIYEANIPSYGTWVISVTKDSDTQTKQLVVNTVMIYEITIEHGIDGSTVTPTDDIQTWLACANITDKSYTTLAEVLADRETFETLIADSNACDYMARSTTWAGSDDTLVPIMTDNTHPSGKASASSAYQNVYLPWKAFDGSLVNNDVWHSDAGAIQWIAYEFEDAVNINKVRVRTQSVAGPKTSKVQYSIDGTTWNDINEDADFVDCVNAETWYEKYYENNIKAKHFRLYITDSNYVPGGSKYSTFYELEFCHNAICQNESAMSLIGKYDYACNALLGNEVWAEAIANSDYWDKVLENIIPIMTDNTHPSGTAMCSTYSTASSITWGAWQAFNKGSGADPTVGWRPSANGAVNEYVAYQFDEMPSNVFRYKIVCRHSVGGVVGGYLQGYDGSEWQNLTEYLTLTNDPEGLVSNTYQAYRVYVTARSTASGYYYIPIFALYGRLPKTVYKELVPTMTSDTTPSGEAFASYVQSGSYAYYAFDKNTSTIYKGTEGAGSYLAYKFTKPVCAKRMYIDVQNGQGKIMASKDNVTWVELNGGQQYVSSNSRQQVYVDINNDEEYLYYRIQKTVATPGSGNGMFVYELQFYEKTVDTNIIHSCANDTIYYLDNGSPVIIATTNASGIGICDFSLLDDKVYTLYSTVAKDPTNLSNPYSKQVRITNTTYGCTTELYVMPDAVKTLYWWGYMSGDCEELNTANGWSYSGSTFRVPSRNTNSMRFSSSNGVNIGVGSKNAVSASKVNVVTQGVTIAYNSYGFVTTYQSKSNWSGEKAITNASLSKTEITSSGDKYIFTHSSAGRVMDLYAFWYE